MKYAWCFKLTDKSGEITGTVDAVDPRDALSRTLTSEVGMKFAEKNQISVDILQEAPANFDSVYGVRNSRYEINLHKQCEVFYSEFIQNS